jgi:hypothetical protein
VSVTWVWATAQSAHASSNRKITRRFMVPIPNAEIQGQDYLRRCCGQRCSTIVGANVTMVLHRW